MTASPNTSAPRRSAAYLAACVLALFAFGCDDGDGEDLDAGTDAGAVETDAGEADAGGEDMLELTPELCDDPSNLSRIDMSGGGGSPSYGTLNVATAMQLLSAPTEGPFYMVNLIHFRDRAVYADGRETNLTGEEANALYSPVEFLTAIGARPVFTADVSEVTTGEMGAWDQVAIVEYPCPLALFAMSAHPEFQARSIHKDAGVETSIVIVTNLRDSTLPPGFVIPDSPYPATADDPAFERVGVYRYREMAMYEPSAGEPARTGREAMDLFFEGSDEANERIGIVATARFDVQGVLIGDGREWDEVRIDYVPSRAGYDALQIDAAFTAVTYHQDAAVEDAYEMIAAPGISSIPGAPATE